MTADNLEALLERVPEDIEWQLLYENTKAYPYRFVVLHKEKRFDQGYGRTPTQAVKNALYALGESDD